MDNRAMPRDAALRFLSRDWSGLAVAGAVFAAACLVLAASSGHALGLLAGVALAAIGITAGAGAVRHLTIVGRGLARHPPPGRLIDIGGYRVHVLAEGDAGGLPSVVWFAGAHAPGLAIGHLHRALRGEARSILIDRPGTGWSDPGPFPRTTPLEAKEMIAALLAAGEPGPFVFVGHSFGGLLAAHMARLRPDLTAALVLLDATPPDTIIFGPRFPGLSLMAGQGFRRALRLVFGWHPDLDGGQTRPDPVYAAVIEKIDRALGPEQAALRALSLRARTACADASIFRELQREHLASVAWETAIYDGDLDGVPVLLVAPGDVGADEMPPPGAVTEPERAAERARMSRVVGRTRERYMAVSNLSRRVYAPTGTGHNFPFETPDFVTDVVREALRAHAGPALDARDTPPR